MIGFNRMKKLFDFCFICLLFSFLIPVISFADSDKNISVGYIKSGSSEIGIISWKPDIRLGTWSLGFDINFPLGQNRPSDFDSFVFRYAEYNDRRKGLRYGVVDNLTWGKGLLMKNYSSRISGPINQNNTQAAFLGFLNADRISFKVLSTWSHIYALHLSEQINPMLTLGQSYITDVDGVSTKLSDGTTINNPSISGFGIDATVPLPLNFEGYAEAAQLSGYGSGLTFGLNWGFDAMAFSAMFDASYRTFDQKFVPGYFNSIYETNPINLSSYEASSYGKNGYIAEINLLVSKSLKMNALYEYYNGSKNASLNANVSGEYDKIAISGYFTQPNFQDFRSLTLEQGAVVGASVGYKINPTAIIVTHYKKYYDSSLGKIVESQYYEMKLAF